MAFSKGITPKDMHIMNMLRTNAKEKLTTIAEILHMPVSTVHERIKHLDALKRPTYLIDTQLLGYSTSAHILLRCNKEDKQALARVLMSRPETNALFKVNSGYDFLVEAVFKNIKCVEEMIEDINDQVTIKTHHVIYTIEELARERFLVSDQS